MGSTKLELCKISFVRAKNGGVSVPIDWNTSREDWISAVCAILIPKLNSDVRFDRSGELIARFHHEVDIWRGNDFFRPVIEFGNELAAAECILSSMPAGERLIYEPSMAGTQKRIDFLKLDELGSREWIEVKTVSPQWVDDEAGWDRFLELSKDFPENARLVVDKSWSGAAISGQALKARWTFIQKTIDVEERARYIPADMSGPIWLLLCSTGSNWHKDELEDFADLYRTGQPRTDDWTQNMTVRYMQDRGLMFNGSLAGFHYLERSHCDVLANKFFRNVVGPSIGL